MPYRILLLTDICVVSIRELWRIVLCECPCVCLFGTCMYTFMLWIHLKVNLAYSWDIYLSPSIYLAVIVPHCFSNVFVPIHTLPSNVREFKLFQHLVLSVFFNISHSGRYGDSVFYQMQLNRITFIYSELTVGQIKEWARPQATLNPVGGSQTCQQTIATYNMCCSEDWLTVEGR